MNTLHLSRLCHQLISLQHEFCHHSLQQMMTLWFFCYLGSCPWIAQMPLLKRLGYLNWMSNNWQNEWNQWNLVLRMVKTFLDHLSVVLSGNFDKNILMMSGVLNTFHLCRWSTFSCFIQKFWNFWYALVSPAMMRGQFLDSLL